MKAINWIMDAWFSFAQLICVHPRNRWLYDNHKDISCGRCGKRLQEMKNQQRIEIERSVRVPEALRGKSGKIVGRIGGHYSVKLDEGETPEHNEHVFVEYGCVRELP